MGRDIKITVVGETSVGKTSLLISYTTNSFPSEHVPTVFDNFSANAIVDEESITLGLWDTAGSSEFNELRPLSYPGTDVFIICYSIIDPKSLQSVQDRWVPEISTHCPGVPIILVGTKLDLRSKPEQTGLVTIQDAEKMAKQIDAVTLIECSALTQEKLADVFQQTIRAVINPSKLKADASKPKSVNGKVKTPNKEKKDGGKKKQGFFGKPKDKKKLTSQLKPKPSASYPKSLYKERFHHSRHPNN
jgi:small GTP-binding protein